MTRRAPHRPAPALHGSAALLVALAGACRTSGGPSEVAFTLGAQGLPGAGASATLAQRMRDHGDRRIDLELGLERQELPDEGPQGDDWSRIWLGLASAAREPRSHWQARAGVTWLRTEAEAGGLEDPGDYGGGYVGAGYAFQLSPSLSTGPGATLLYVDSEGDRSGSGSVVQLVWTWTWHL